MKPPADPSLRNALNRLKQAIADVVGVLEWFKTTFNVGNRWKHVSAFDIAMDVGGGLLEQITQT